MDYQVMPDLTPEEYEELKADIAERGVMVPIEFDENGDVLDGHHRLRACRELGITEYPTVVREGMTEEQKRTHARKLNMLRRHLSREQKQELIRQQLRETPEQSDNSIARVLGVSDKTVTKQRRELEAGSEIPNLTTATGADGKQYPRQVDRKPAAPKQSVSILDAYSSPDDTEEDNSPIAYLRQKAAEAAEKRKTEPPWKPWEGIGEILASNPPSSPEPEDPDAPDINSFFKHVQQEPEPDEPEDTEPEQEPASEPEPETEPGPEPEPEEPEEPEQPETVEPELEEPGEPDPEPEETEQPETEQPGNVIEYHEFLNAQTAQMDKWRKAFRKFYGAVMYPSTHDADEIAEACWNLMRLGDSAAEDIDHEITDTIQSLTIIQGKIRMGGKLYGCHGTQ